MDKSKQPSEERIHELLDEVIDSPSGENESMAELQSLLLKDEAARKHAVRRLFDESLLTSETNRSHSEDLFAQIRPFAPTNRIRNLLVAALALASAILLAMYLGSPQSGLSPDSESSELSALDRAVLSRANVVDLHPQDECAVLTRAIDATWAVDNAVPKLGSTLTKGRLVLESGLIQLDFCSGARAVLEGPGDIELLTPERAICHRGKLRVFAPPQASGFVISIPGMVDVVDLGTEFALNVGENGDSQVHVLDGEVRLQSEESDLRQLLCKGESAAFDQEEGLTKLVESRPSEEEIERLFVGGKRIAKLFDDERRERSMNAKFPFREDENVIFYYDFDEPAAWSSIVENKSACLGAAANGAAVGCEWRPGRWEGDTTIEMKGVSDRIRLNISGEYGQLTYIAWVNMDGFNRRRNALVLSDGWEIGAAHWQLAGDGRIVLGLSEVFNEERGVFEGLDYFSPAVLDRSDLGRWVLLATTYDQSTQEVRHYFNGVFLSSERVRIAPKVRFGGTEIGNWRPKSQPKFLTRTFNGRFAEIAMLSRALSDEEVATAYEVGRP